jgi:hypothetical protein
MLIVITALLQYDDNGRRKVLALKRQVKEYTTHYFEILLFGGIFLSRCK